MKKLFGFAFLALLTGLCLCSGCKTQLEPGGAYAPTSTNADGVVTATAAPDLALFTLDASYDLAYNAILTACRIEKQNRALLRTISPQIKLEMDKVRAATWEIDQQWAAARAAYLTNPVAANLTPIQRALAELQRWNATATALLPKDTHPPLPP